MKRKKTRAALPRVTILAYSRRDLAAFVEAVEAMRCLTEDLRAEVAALKAKRMPARPAALIGEEAAQIVARAARKEGQ